MKKALLALVAAALLLPGFSFAANTVTWQTTRGGSNSGYCQLESNKLSLTVTPCYVDVVEEAVIGTMGSISWGDPSTLEIVGQFTLSKGTALRSMLLWNGNQILKAKLLDRKSADSAYQNVVNREIPRDPAIIDYLGNDTYRYRIFPVAINASRKIRILYTVPFHLSSKGPAFAIKTAFTAGANMTPTQVPVEMDKASPAGGNYMLSYGTVNKTIQFGSTYIIPYSDLAYNMNYYGYYYYDNWTMNPLLITPDTSSRIVAYTAKIDAGKAAGNYTAVYATPPNAVLAAVRELSNSGAPTFEARVVIGTEAYITDFNNKNYLGVYLKSATPWDSTIYWTVYNASGKIALSHSQKCSPQSDSLTRSVLPLIWGAKYSLVEGTGNLGALYGFVDRKMSLLALEKDTLCAAEALLYALKGVPVLKQSEIVINPADVPAAPVENIIFEYSSGVVKSIKENILSFVLSLKGRILSITFRSFKNGAVRVALYDLAGKQLASWNDLRVSGNTLTLELSRASIGNARGCMVVRVYSGSEMFQKKLVMAQ